MGSENRRRRFRGNLKSSVTRSIAPERAALENRRYLPKRLLLPQSSQRDADGGAERLRVLNEFRDLRSQTWGELTASWRTSDTSLSTFGDSRSPSSSSCRTALPVCRHTELCASPPARWERVSSFDGLTVLVIRTDMTYTVTRQTTLLLPPAGPQNALDKSHTKPPARQAARRTGVLDRCRRAKDKPGGQPRRVAPLLERRLAPERRSQPCSERVGQTPLIRLQG